MENILSKLIEKIKRNISFSPATVNILNAPDFYLSSDEGYDLDEPRKCWILKRLGYKDRTDFALVAVDPPVIYRDKYEGDLLLNQVILAARLKGSLIFESDVQWPIYVYVFKILCEDILTLEKINDSHIRNIAWAALYPTREAAEKKLL